MDGAPTPIVRVIGFQSFVQALRAHVPLILILLVAAGLRLLYIDAPLLDAHRWRQVDTAFMARAFSETGINPFKPEANWGGAHGYVESEFPLLPALVAVLYQVFGEDDTWGRLVVAAFSVGAVGLTYVLARMLLGVPGGLAAALLMAVSPSAVFYGRTFMPDTLMVFFSLGALIAFMRYAESGSNTSLVAGAVCLTATVLVKLPGVLVFAPIACALWVRRRWSAVRDHRLVLALALSCALAAAWYCYAYRIYLQTGLTFGVIGTTKTYPLDVASGAWPTAFSKWSSVELLTSREFYRTIFARLYFLHLTPPGLALSVIGLLVWRRMPARRVIDAWLLAMLAFVLVAGGGHMGHDYYQLPLVPIGALYFAAAAWPVFDVSWIRRAIGPGVAARVVTALAVGGIGVLGFVQSGVIERHFRPDNLDVRIWLAGQAIDAAAENNSLMVVVDDYGVNSPVLLYFARARGWSLDADTATAYTVAGLQSRKGARYSPPHGGRTWRANSPTSRRSSPRAANSSWQTRPGTLSCTSSPPPPHPDSLIFGVRPRGQTPGGRTARTIARRSSRRDHLPAGCGRLCQATGSSAGGSACTRPAASATR